MPNIVAPQDQDVAYYHFMSCIKLLKKQNIVAMNLWKRENQPFPLHPSQTRVAKFWRRGQDKV